MLRKDLENKIRDNLISLSDEDAQRLCEEFVHIVYPDFYPYFVFRALSPEGKTRSGWPDALSKGIDGKYHGVEATHTSSRSGIENHLLEYCKKVSELRRAEIGRFIHISVSPKVSFSQDKISYWTEKFIQAGIQRDNISLIFGQGLVEMLTRPEFARTRVEVLGISHLPSSFRPIRSRSRPDEQRLGSSFIPGWDEFEAGRIYRPELAEAVTAKLSRDRIALVRGIGASGKTVLAWLLAHEVLKLGFPAYYYDFAATSDITFELTNALSTDLTLFGHSQVLFIIDNIHLDETATKEIYLSWEEIPMPNRPKLLLVGREIHHSRGSPLGADNLIEPLTLRARQAELRGVFRRLVQRGHNDEEVPEPTEAVLTEWLQTFGGRPEEPRTTADLIIFSAAVVRRIKDLRRGSWKLQHDDAIEQVRNAYLKKLLRPELDDLIRLCVLQEMEISATEELFSDRISTLEICVKRLGIVFRHDDERRGRRKYRLVHTALASLLLSAIDDNVDKNAIIIELSRHSPNINRLAVKQKIIEGEIEIAKDMIAIIISNPSFLLIYESLQNIELHLSLVNRLSIELPKQFDADLADAGRDQGRLISMALLTPIHSHAAFLSFAKSSLPSVFELLSRELANTERWPSLLENALQSSLEKLIPFLSLAKTSLPSVFAMFYRELASAERLQVLIDKALQQPLDQLVGFLSFAKSSLPRVFAVWSNELSLVDRRPILVEKAIQTPLDHLVGFLNFARSELPLVHSAIEGFFFTTSGKTILSQKIIGASEDKIHSCLVQGEATTIWKKALNEICLTEWTNSRRSGLPPVVDAFFRFQKVVSSFGKPEFAYAPADRIVTESPKSDWERIGIGLHHLSHVIRLSRGTTYEQKREFILRVVSSEWLENQYSSVNAGILAGSLFSLASYLPSSLLKYFNHEELQTRVTTELRTAYVRRLWAEPLSLWAAADRFGVSCNVGSIRWPSNRDIEHVLRLRTLPKEGKPITAQDFQLWLGLRLMAIELRYPLFIPADIGEHLLRILRTFQKSDFSPIIIAWLDACKRNHWALVPPPR